MEVLWKTVLGMINCRIGAVVQFHNVFHGFHTGWWVGTAYLESKLLHKLIEMREEVLHEFFLNLRN